jgi:hypothetical protein
MTELSWFPEPFQAYGSLAGEGTRRVLGKPRLDPLTVLVRETVQNSWDAKRSDADAVTFALDGWILGDEQLRTLRHEVFNGLPPGGIDLGEVLDREEVSVLVISDSGTVGLTGPVRADLPVAGRSDFIDLVFNMGQPRDIPGGGGTYGFGKTISYIVSEASTVILYTRTRVDAELESRLIGVAVGSQYATDLRRFTGRHWWGVSLGARVEPLTGNLADDLARRLGFPSLDGDATGLAMMLIAPRFDGRSPRQAMTFLASALTWNFWPKMVPRSAGSGNAPMDFRMSWQGELIPIPQPDRFPPLGAYVKALQALHAHEDGLDVDVTVGVIPVSAHKPNRQLGLLAVTRVPHEPRVAVDEGADADDDLDDSAVFGGNSHHVALMRRVELVVKYLEGPELPGPHVEWAGVFVNDPDIEQSFADAEPPTHDDWQPSMVEDRQSRRLVNLALKYIGEELRREFGPVVATPSAAATTSAAVIGNALGGLIASVPGIGTAKLGVNGPGSVSTGGVGKSTESGAGGNGGGAGGGTSGLQVGFAAPRAIVDIATGPAVVDGEAGAEVQFSVETHGLQTKVIGTAHAAIDGTAPEREPPLGAQVPEVIGWKRPSDAAISVPGCSLTVAADDTEPWVMVVRNPAGAAVAVDVRVASSRGSA